MPSTFFSFEGFDLRKSPQIERKRVLKMLFDETKLKSPIVYSDHLLMDGNEMYTHACKLKLGRDHLQERRGAVSFRPQRGWLKVKCAQRAKFPSLVS